MRNNTIAAITATLCAGLIGATAQAAGPVTQRSVSLDMANRIAAAGVAACAAKGYAVAVAVVDRAGQIRAIQRADNAGPHTLASAEQKAFTSASARNTTMAMMEASQKNPGSANLGAIPGFLLLGGGVPVKAGNEVIGAVGIGGAPAGQLDEQCAMTALEAVKDDLK